MINSKKIFAGALSLVFASCFTNSSAQANIENPAILFKIHDIKPVMNSEGQTNSCDFSVTLFNRSDEIINGADIDLTWEDNTIKVLSDIEKNDPAAKARRTNVARGTSETITTNIEIPAIMPLKQVTINSRLQSDRCFLLMGPLKMRVKSCNLASQTRSGSRSATVCANLFTHVTADSSEYYREFSNVAASEEKVEQLKANEKIKKEINDSYTQTISEFERATQLIKEIK